MQPSRWVLPSTLTERQRLVKRGALCRFCVHSLRANLCSGSSCSRADLCEDTKGVEGKTSAGRLGDWEVDVPENAAIPFWRGYSFWSGILQVKSIWGRGEF